MNETKKPVRKQGLFFRLLSNSLFEPRKGESKTRSFVLVFVSGAKSRFCGACMAKIRKNFAIIQSSPVRKQGLFFRLLSNSLFEPRKGESKTRSFVLVFVRGANPRFCGACMAKIRKNFAIIQSLPVRKQGLFLGCCQTACSSPGRASQKQGVLSLFL